MNRTTFGIAIALLAIVVALPRGLDLFAQSSDTFTAKATPGNEIENAASITITFVVNRYTTESENTTVRNRSNRDRPRCGHTEEHAGAWRDYRRQQTNRAEVRI